ARRRVRPGDVLLLPGGQDVLAAARRDPGRHDRAGLPVPASVLAGRRGGRLVAAIIETLILMGVVYGVVSAFVTLHFHWTAAALVPMAFLILTGIGYSL